MHRKINTEPSCLPVIPGRGLVVKSAIEMRQAFLEQQDISIQNIKYTNLELSEIQNNIESYIGSVEIPLGVVGPMLFKDEAQEELVYWQRVRSKAHSLPV